MRVIKGLLLMSLLIPLLLSLFPKQASACSCAGPSPVEEELGRKTAVFSGKVIDIVDKKAANAFMQSSADPVTVLFEVKEIWKGSNQSQIIVQTAREEASCGFNFKLDEEYIVYAYGDGEKLETGFCERTKLLSAAGEDKDILGKGKVPTQSVDLQDEIDRSNLTFYLYMIAICFVLLVVSIVIGKRLKKS